LNDLIFDDSIERKALKNPPPSPLIIPPVFYYFLSFFLFFVFEIISDARYFDSFSSDYSNLDSSKEKHPFNMPSFLKVAASHQMSPMRSPTTRASPISPMYDYFSSTNSNLSPRNSNSIPKPLSPFSSFALSCSNSDNDKKTERPLSPLKNVISFVLFFFFNFLYE
jgi:hypothetical protein